MTRQNINETLCSLVEKMKFLFYNNQMKTMSPVIRNVIQPNVYFHITYGPGIYSPIIKCIRAIKPDHPSLKYSGPGTSWYLGLHELHNLTIISTITQHCMCTYKGSYLLLLISFHCLMIVIWAMCQMHQMMEHSYVPILKELLLLLTW
jgi:hypothetical protein